MGGSDKGLQLLRGRPMAAWVIERFAPQVGEVLINANRNADAYRAFGKTIVADRIEGFPGPLAGLHAGLTVCPTGLLASVPCDTPFLPADLVARLREDLERAGAEVAVARAAGRLQPVFALMKRSVLPKLDEFLAGGGRSAGAWFESQRIAQVEFADAQAFSNINTREELDALSAPAR